MNIVLLPINHFERRQAENMENTNPTLEENKAMYRNGALFHNLEDFTELCNDQVINLDDYWITYIK